MYWKIALAQHPMYILVREDTVCAERTPPWGAPDIGSYINRLRQNIDTLRKYPQIKIGYEWSGLELEQLKEDAPDVFDEMLDLVSAGQTTFYNGTYSQPHLQTLSSEANYRQFEWGARVYRQLCHNHQVLVYAHQESSVNEQTPQLLKSFGIQSVVMPNFSSTLTMIDGGELNVHSRFGTMFIHGEEFAAWRGLDGTVIDLYLNEPKHNQIKDWLAFQEVIGLTHVPPIVVEMPDLIEVNKAWIEERSQADFVLLDEVLAERLKAFPPRFRVRFYTNWSYIEGIRAEELSRNNWKAENSVLRAEALNSLAFALVNRSPDSTDPVWKKILTTQHHDVYCFCAPILRQKSMGWLQEAKAEATQIASAAAEAITFHIDTSAAGSHPVVVFNTLPNPVRGVACVEVDAATPAIKGPDGRLQPMDAAPLPSGKTLVRFLAELPGLGYTTFGIQDNGETPIEETLKKSFIFENGFYRAIVQPDGTFTSLVLKPSGDELLEGAGHPGNLLAGRDSTGLGPKHEGTFDLTNPVKWEPSGRGPELNWQPTGPVQGRHSSLGATFTIPGKMGPSVKAVLVLHFYHDLARIDLDWAFTFSEACLGHFYDDDTKLRVQWPLSFEGIIHHDISFGVVDTRSYRPFFPASWVDSSDGNKGLAYFHQGTLKHWVTGKTLVNLFAWGEDTDAIGNRMDMVRWPKCFDQRLRGSHTIHTAIYPHSGDWRTADVIGAARSFGMAPVAYVTGSHQGDLPDKMVILKLPQPEIVATAVKIEDNQILCRFYSVSQQTQFVESEIEGLSLVGMTSLLAEPFDQIGSFQIGRLHFKPVR